MQQTLPTLYHKGKTGAIIEWRVWAEGVSVIREWGQRGGAKQRATHHCEAKNVGRANGTTAEEQAVIEAKALWVYQRDRKYRESITDAEETIFLPMLARSKTLNRKNLANERHVRWPLDVQIKFDGVRCLAYKENGKVFLISRNGKPWCVPHIEKQLQALLPDGAVLDGELYLHGVGFQTITSWVKRLQEDTKRVEYHVYDCAEYENITEEVWPIRKKHLEKIFKTKGSKAPNVIKVETKTAKNFDEVEEYVAEFVADGYEGGIARLYQGTYKYGERSNFLLKLKDFIDGEYPVIGVTVGEWGTKEENAAIWVCSTDLWKPTSEEKRRVKGFLQNFTTTKELRDFWSKIPAGCFKARPMGTIGSREAALRTAGKKWEKPYKVKFFEYTDDKVPRFPVGLGFREKQDM